MLLFCVVSEPTDSVPASRAMSRPTHVKGLIVRAAVASPVTDDGRAALRALLPDP